MADRLVVQLNGVERSFDDVSSGANVAALVDALGFRHDRVALEQNGNIVPRSTWGATIVQSGDHIELVHFVGGGTCPVDRRASRV